MCIRDRLWPFRACEKRVAFWSKWRRARPEEAGRLQRAMLEFRPIAKWYAYRLGPLGDECALALCAGCATGVRS
eukprot:3809750-Lingulodinium_polyedra.AAC.1